jgi:hypothetical protein
VDYDPVSKTVVVLPGEVCATATVRNSQKYIGFTPGFWKNHGVDAPSGKNAWEYLQLYEEGSLIGDVFDDGGSGILNVTPKKSDKPMDLHTLMEGLSFKGGPGPEGAAEILLRAGIAALLNADISAFLEAEGLLNGYAPYPYTVAEVLAEVNGALASGDAATMLGVATVLDDMNNDASHYFDWYPPE